MKVEPVEYDDFVILEILDDEMKLTVNMTNISEPLAVQIKLS